MFKHAKHGKEYRKELIRTPTLWIGVFFIVLGLIFLYLKFNTSVSMGASILGFFLLVMTKYRILGRLDERYK